MNRSESIKELAAALVKSHGGFKSIKRDKTVLVKTRIGGSYTFSYAPLESIFDAVIPSLIENEIILSQDVQDGKVVTTLIHSSGEFISSGGTIIKLSEETGAQAYGSAMTYARRYDATLFLGLCADEDDDANAAEGNQLSKPAFSAPHKPTDGAKESLSPVELLQVKTLAGTMLDYMNNGEMDIAFEKLEKSGFSNDQKVALWPHFDSKQRAALKSLAEKARAKS